MNRRNYYSASTGRRCERVLILRVDNGGKVITVGMETVKEINYTIKEAGWSTTLTINLP